MARRLLHVGTCVVSTVGLCAVILKERKRPLKTEFTLTRNSTTLLSALNAQDLHQSEHSKVYAVENDQEKSNDHGGLLKGFIHTNVNFLSKDKMEDALDKMKDLLSIEVVEKALPGLVVGVSVDGKTVATFSLGYSDVENMIPCKPSTVMRIASISKAMTMVAAAELVDQGKLDLDKSVRDYLPEWPSKHPNITIRHLVSHLSGIRHYSKKPEVVLTEAPPTPPSSPVLIKCTEEKDDSNNANDQAIKKVQSDGSNDSEFPEFLLNKKFHSVSEAMEIFKNDELLSKPGEEFHYTTHGFTVLSAVIESVVSEPFGRYMVKFFKKLGLKNTYLDENEPVIKQRSRFYMRSPSHQLINAPHVDNSCKWAGGGFLSTVSDLLSFGNAVLYSYQFQETNSQKGTVDQGSDETCGHGVANQISCQKPLLNPNTVMKMWSPVVPMYKSSSLNYERHYGMGWIVVPPCSNFAHCKTDRFVVSHSGGAVGASSMLLILPSRPVSGHFDQNSQSNPKSDPSEEIPPRGVVVSMITNLGNVGLYDTAFKVAELFESASTSS